MIPRFAVIPTNGRECVLDAVAAVRDQAQMTFVVWTNTREHGEVLPQWAQAPPDGVMVIYDLDSVKEINISRWWNVGLGWGEQYARKWGGFKKWDVAILNDDAIVPEGWFDAVSGTMRQMGVAAGCSGAPPGMPVLHTRPGPVGLETRLQGFAYIVAGELGLRANEQLRWYFTDDYMDWESRKLGGMVMVPGFRVNHLYPNGQMSPEIEAQVAQDAQTFVNLYGMRPW